MPLTWLTGNRPFPPTALALGPDSDAPGLLAAGGDLSPARLLAAYSRGIFPWYGEGQPVLWWTTDPRMVLPVSGFRLHRSLRKTLQQFLQQPGARISFDQATADVINACATSPRDGQAGTWIVPEMVQAYLQLHHQGHVHSVETWIDGELVGGLYGVGIGRMFFGESMFARRTDTSKIALAALVAWCRAEGITLIDCQQQTRHLASLGAYPVPRAEFEAHLGRVIPLPTPARWAYDPAHWALLDPRLAALRPAAAVGAPLADPAP